MGNNKPFVICANLIISIDLNPTDENKTPNPKINIQTALNCFDFMLVGQPKHPVATKAAAKGAVMALVIPAANKPIA